MMSAQGDDTFTVNSEPTMKLSASYSLSRRLAHTIQGIPPSRDVLRCHEVIEFPVLGTVVEYVDDFDAAGEGVAVGSVPKAVGELHGVVYDRGVGG